MKILDNGEQLETRYAKFYRNAIQGKVQDDYSYDQYWARIEPELLNKKVIYFSPDGVYNQLNLNTHFGNPGAIISSTGTTLRSSETRKTLLR